MTDASFSANVDDRIRALSELHAQKVRSLMKSVNTLRGKVKELTRANKNHKRSAHIQALQTQVREHELVVDMLKQLLSDRTGMGRDEVSTLVIKKTTGGPKRFRPKIREELEQELQTVTRRYNALKAKASSGGSSKARRGSSASSASRRSGGSKAEVAARASVTSRTPRRSGGGSSQQQAAKIAQLSEEVETLTVKLAALQQATQEMDAENERLHESTRQMKQHEDKLRRVSAKYAQTKDQVEKLQAETTAQAADLEQTTEELRAAQEENRFLQEELANVQEDASKRYRDAEAKVNELQGQYMSVSDKLEAATQGGRSRAGATQDTRELRAEIDRLKEQVRTQASQIETLTTDLDDAEQEVEQLATYKMSHESSAATLGETGGGADARVAQLEAELEEERQQAARAANSAAEHQRKLQDAVADATAAMERASEQNSNLRQQLKSGDKQSRDDGALLLAQQALDAARAEAAAASTRATAAERALEDTRARLASVSDNVKAVEASLAKEVTAHRDDLAKVAEDKFADASDVTEAMDDLDEDVNKIKAMLEGQMSALIKDAQLTAEQAETYKQSAASLHAYAAILQHRLKSLNHEPPEMPKEVDAAATGSWGAGYDRMVGGEEGGAGAGAGGGAGAGAGASVEASAELALESSTASQERRQKRGSVALRKPDSARSDH